MGAVYPEPRRSDTADGTATARRRCLGPIRSSPIAGKAVRVTFDGGRLTSDAGVLVLAEIERRLGIAERLARCLADPRSPERVHHTLAEMIRFRVLLIAAGYPDANDCDALSASTQHRPHAASEALLANCGAHLLRGTPSLSSLRIAGAMRATIACVSSEEE